jgi:hypothetical protein
MVSEVIIIGGGNSINEGLALGLKEKLQDKFVVALNYSYKYFPHTYLCFMDKLFYKSSNTTQNPDIYEELKQEALIIGKEDAELTKHKLPNTILLKSSSEYQREKAKLKGFYNGSLTGIFAITVATYLMNFKGNLFLLGYDWNRRNPTEVDKHNYSGNTDIKTHYYSDIKHRGVGWVSYYENHSPETYFKCFIDSELKIYNVSLNSNINCFERISFEHMFTLLNNEKYNQDEIRESIKNKLRS